MRMMDIVQNDDLVRNWCKKMAPPLVTLLGSEPEVQYVALRNINLIVQKRPAILANEVKVGAYTHLQSPSSIVSLLQPCILALPECWQHLGFKPSVEHTPILMWYTVDLCSRLAAVVYISINCIKCHWPAQLTSCTAAPTPQVFFCKYNDPIYVKMEKLEIMIKLASDKNIDQVLLEFKEYAQEVDVDFVRKVGWLVMRRQVGFGLMCWLHRPDLVLSIACSWPCGYRQQLREMAGHAVCC